LACTPSLFVSQDDEVISKRAQLELVNAYIASIRVPKELKQRLTKFFRARLKSKSLSSVHGDTIYQVRHDAAAVPRRLSRTHHVCCGPKRAGQRGQHRPL
jgi:hypothetical protein